MDKKPILILFLLLGLIYSISAVSAHEGMENPIVTIENLTPGSEVSDNVDFKINVHEHNEAKYVNVTAQNMDDHKIYFNKQDSNRAGGWSVSWDTSNAPNGEYWITATAVDVKNLEGKAEMKLILNNLPKESHIVLEQTTPVVNKSTNVVAKILDESNNALSNKDLTFEIDGVDYGTVKTTSEGVALISFTPSEVKDYKIVVKFGGDNKYIKSQIEGLIKVSSNINATIVSISDVSGNNKEKILLKANLVAPGFYEAIYNKKIDFYINGNLVGSAFTDEKGDAEFEYVINETGGTHVYSVKYQDENKTNYTDYASLHVPESELYMTMSAVTYSVDGIFMVSNQFKVTFVVNNNGPDTSKNTVFKYNIPNSLKYVSSSVSKGKLDTTSNQLVWNLGDMDIGSQQVEVLFQVVSADKINLTGVLSTDTYDKSIGNAVPTRFLTVNNYQLKASNLVKYYTGSKKYRVYLYSQDGKGVAGANVKITIGKQSVNLKTNSAGYVELDVNLKAGSYNVKVTCNKLSISNKIVIKPLIVTKNISKKKSKVVKFTAKVLNNKGKVVKNKKVTFKFKGKKYKVKTNKRGIATLSLKNLKKGKFVIYTSYGKSTVKNTIKIK